MAKINRPNSTTGTTAKILSLPDGNGQTVADLWDVLTAVGGGGGLRKPPTARAARPAGNADRPYAPCPSTVDAADRLTEAVNLARQTMPRFEGADPFVFDLECLVGRWARPVSAPDMMEGLKRRRPSAVLLAAMVTGQLLLPDRSLDLGQSAADGTLTVEHALRLLIPFADVVATTPYLGSLSGIVGAIRRKGYTVRLSDAGIITAS